jgi:probable rRNA maturation factor
MNSDCDIRNVRRDGGAAARGARIVVDSAAAHQLWQQSAAIEALVEMCAAAVAQSAAWSIDEEAHVTLALGSDADIRPLNAAWRGKDQATNVLSFPARPGTREDGVLYLGDIMLAYETIVREAEDLGIPFDDHVRHLVVHGLLHLAGFDHEVDHDATIMEAHEVTILATLGVANPYRQSDVETVVRSEKRV